jgi:hypothetical protein
MAHGSVVQSGGKAAFEAGTVAFFRELADRRGAGLALLAATMVGAAAVGVAGGLLPARMS